MAVYLGSNKVCLHGGIQNVTDSGEISLQSKTVTPSESSQTVTPDNGYGGLSQVTVDGISTTYIGSGITQKSASTYTPTTSDQTITGGQYLSGDQIIKGDVNLIAENIKSGVSIFNILGTLETGSGGSSSGSELTMKTGETTSNVIDTGLSSVSAFVLYTTTITAAGLATTVYTSESGVAKTVYCNSYSNYMKTISTASLKTDISIDGGTVTWNGTNSKAMINGVTYDWIAVGNS